MGEEWSTDRQCDTGPPNPRTEAIMLRNHRIRNVAERVIHFAMLSDMSYRGVQLAMRGALAFSTLLTSVNGHELPQPAGHHAVAPTSYDTGNQSDSRLVIIYEGAGEPAIPVTSSAAAQSLQAHGN